MYIGLTDYCDEGHFTWKSDGTSLAFQSWDNNEPNDYQGNEDCVQLNQRNQWNDLRCLTEQIENGAVMTALCQLPK